MTIRGWIASLYSSYYARTRNSAWTAASMLFLACAAPLCAQTRAGAAARRQAAERADRADDRAARDLAEAGLKGERAAEKRLLLALDGPQGKARYAAIRSLGLLRSKEAAARLAGLAKSKDAGERELAFEALARAGEPAAAAAACRAGEAAGCRALQWADAGAAESALRAALSRPDPAARAASAFALARTGAKEAGPAAALLLKDPAPSVRVEAAQALAALGDASFLGDIEAASANETDALARQTFAAASRRLRR